MKPTPFQTSVISSLTIPEAKLEDFFCRHDERRTSKPVRLVNNYKGLKWCAVEVTVTGTVQIVLTDRKNSRIRASEIPIAASFFVSGNKTEDSEYKFAFAASLS